VQAEALLIAVKYGDRESSRNEKLKGGPASEPSGSEPQRHPCRSAVQTAIDFVARPPAVESGNHDRVRILPVDSGRRRIRTRGWWSTTDRLV